MSTPKLYHSVEECLAGSQSDTVEVARRFGLDTTQQVGAHVLCGMHGTAEHVDAYPDGSWEYSDGESKPVTGLNSVILGYFLASDRKESEE